MDKKHTIFILSIIVLVSGLSYAYGVKSYSSKWFPYPQAKHIYEVFKDKLNIEENIASKQEADIKQLKGKTLTILTLGQSNAANYGKTKYSSQNNVYNFYYVNGKTYKASDPLLGSDGDGGSVWTRMGDKLIEQGICDNVIFIPIGMGGSSIKRWGPGGDLNNKIIQAIKSSQNAGLSIDYILWHQGEAEIALQTRKDSYKEMFMPMLNTIRESGVYAPIYVALATEKESLGGREIYNAQIELINGRDIRLGPKVFEELNSLDYHYEYAHFSDSGLNKLSDLWIQAINK